MSDADPGPGRYRMVALMRETVAKLQAQIDDALASLTASVNAELAQVDAALTNFNDVAAEAQGAIEASATDRAALHAEQDAQAAAVSALTDRVAALETPAVPPLAPAG